MIEGADISETRNHYCKLTPSAVPRLASILLELHFLDIGKAKV
jgi:hypothetical protein